MTGRERILKVLNGQRTDWLPVMPITMMFAADVLGIKYERYARDYKVMVDAQVKTAEMFGFDHVSAIGPPAPETADLGATVQWYPDQPPSMLEAEALLKDKCTLDVLRTRDAFVGERVENRIRGIELMRERVGADLLVEGWLSGPCAAAADLRGINQVMVDFSDDPAFNHALFDFALERGIHFARLQIEAGADIIGIGDAAASLIGQHYYKEFVWPREKRLVEAIHALGARVRLHICGSTRKILSDTGELGCDLIDIDSPVPLEEARAQMGPRQTLCGNLDPVRELRGGTPKSVVRLLEAMRQKAGPQWIVGAGCEIVRDTPHANIRAMIDFAETNSSRFEPS